MIRSILTGLLTVINMLTVQDISPAVQKKQALAELKVILEHRQKFIKAHAAEYLIWTGHGDAALKEYLKEERLHGAEPKYRIVIWRVLVQAEKDQARKNKWLNKIYDAYKTMDGPDRTHATETLAKLKQPVAGLFREATEQTLLSDDRNLQTYAIWASSYGSVKRMNDNREKLVHMAITDTSTTIRKISSFVLRKEQGLNLQQWDQITTKALGTDKADEMYVTYLTTALVTAPPKADAVKLAQIDALLINSIAVYNVSQRTELAQALAEKGTKKHLQLLNNLLDDKDSTGIYDPASDEGADMRAAAAFAILKIYSRQK